MKLQEEVWLKAVAELKNDVMRTCPTLTGGKKDSESHEAYAERCIQRIQEAVERLEIGRRELNAVHKETK